MPQGLAMRALASLGLAMLLVLGGMWMGHKLATTQTQAAKAKATAAALQRYQEAVQQGQADASALREQLGVQGRYTATLQERTRHAAPLAIQTAPLRAPFTTPAQCVFHAVAAADASAAPVQPEQQAPPQGSSPGVVLSLAAVSLWDSALAGHDVPAGACRADDPASKACAAGSGLELEDAWSNHRINAASCAADRTRLDALINHLQLRQKQ